MRVGSRCGEQAIWGRRRSGRRWRFPGLQLAGVITSSPEKAGKDAADVRRARPSRPGVAATTDVDAALAELRRRRLHGLRRHPPRGGGQRHRAVPAGGRARRDAVAVLALRPALRAAGMGRAADRGRRGGRRHAARQRRRPRLGQRRARGHRRRAVHPDPDHPLPGDLRLLDLRPAVRGEGVVRFRRLDGRGADDAAAVHPDHGVGRQHPAHRPRARAWRSTRSPRRSSACRSRSRSTPSWGRSRRAPRARSGSRSSARSGGRERIVIDHITRIHPSCAPDWPQPDEGVGDHRVIVDGDPQLTIISRADVPGGTRADGGNTTAANRLLGAHRTGWPPRSRASTTGSTCRCSRAARRGGSAALGRLTSPAVSACV